jgi:acyl carrier protein
MMEDAVLEYIRNEYLEDDDEDVDLNADTPLISSGIVDSFSMVSLKRFLERQYGISIPDEEASANAFDTVSRIVELVKKYQGSA